MADAFSILSRELSKAERKLLLARIRFSADPQGEDDEGPAEPDEPLEWDAELEYSRLSLIQKIVIVLRSFFTGTPVFELTEGRLIRKTRAKIEARAPGLIDFAAGVFSQGMKTELETLKPAFGFLRSIIGGIPKQRDFIAFLTGLEVDSLTERIQMETDPNRIRSEPLLTEERQIRSEMGKRFEVLIESITPLEKAGVYRDIQRMQMFESLVSIRLDDAIACFDREADPPFRDLESRLIQLSDLMCVVLNPPSAAAWNALFLFRAGDALENADFDVEQAMDGFLAKAQGSVKTVLSFASRVPLTAILRYIMNDITYVPKEPRGGEEWFVLFKSFWEDRMVDTLHEYSREEKIHACLREAMSQFNMPQLPFLENYRREKFGNLFTARHETSIAIARGFHEAVFLPSIERYLNTVVIDGRFFREENRAAFVDCVQGIAQSYGKINAFERRLSESGDPGKLLRGLAEHNSSPELRTACKETDAEAQRIADAYRNALSQLSRILFGILFGEAGSLYDSITNLSTIGGKENKTIRKGLEEGIRHFDRATALLAEIRDIESD